MRTDVQPTKKRTAKAIEVPESWSAKEAAIFLGTSADWVYDRASDGTLPAFKLANRWRFDPQTLREWYRGQQTAPLNEALAR